MASLSKTVTEKWNNLTCEIYGGQNQIVKQVWCRCGFCQDQMCPDCNINKRKKCPRWEILEPPNHAEAIENFKSEMKSFKTFTLKFFCVNKENGCQESLARMTSFTSQKTLEEALKNHERECVYRSVPCIFSAIVDEFECETEVTFQNVIQHYEETYAISKLDNQVLMAKNDLMLDDEPSTFDTFSHPITFSFNITIKHFCWFKKQASKLLTFGFTYLDHLNKQRICLTFWDFLPRILIMFSEEKWQQLMKRLRQLMKLANALLFLTKHSWISLWMKIASVNIPFQSWISGNPCPDSERTIK